MKRHRHTPEQVVRTLAEGERILNGGGDLATVVRTLEISLKKLVANHALDIDMHKELAEANF